MTAAINETNIHQCSTYDEVNECIDNRAAFNKRKLITYMSSLKKVKLLFYKFDMVVFFLQFIYFMR